MNLDEFRDGPPDFLTLIRAGEAQVRVLYEGHLWLDTDGTWYFEEIDHRG